MLRSECVDMTGDVDIGGIDRLRALPLILDNPATTGTVLKANWELGEL